MIETNDSKSHSELEIIKAIKDGKRIYSLDSESSGNDDLLIAEYNETEEDILTTILDHFDFVDFPTTWSLNLLNNNEIACSDCGESIIICDCNHLLAEKIGYQFDHDGQKFNINLPFVNGVDTEKTLELFDLLEKRCTDKLNNWDREATRFCFKDGSAIVVSGECWDYGFNDCECTCFRGVEHDQKRCELLKSE